jgi:indoleamine 2,3-dioxygenase
MTQSAEYPSFYSPWDALKPTVPLPSYYHPFESLAADLNACLENKTFRKQVLSLPVFTIDKLTSRHHWQRAYLILSILGQAYIWGNGQDDEVLEALPLNISVAWCYVAKKLGSKPVISYLAVEFLNYKVLDASLPLTLEYHALIIP